VVVVVYIHSHFSALSVSWCQSHANNQNRTAFRRNAANKWPQQCSDGCIKCGATYWMQIILSVYSTAPPPHCCRYVGTTILHNVCWATAPPLHPKQNLDLCSHFSRLQARNRQPERRCVIGLLVTIVRIARILIMNGMKRQCHNWTDLVFVANDQCMQSIDSSRERVSWQWIIIQCPAYHKHIASINEWRDDASGQAAKELTTTSLQTVNTDLYLGWSFGPVSPKTNSGHLLF